MKMYTGLEYQIAIIGLGPKGLYGLERMLAFINHMDVPIPVSIHLFNKTPYFGAGDIYRPDQPEYLKMNFTDRNIDLRPPHPPSCIVPLQNFTEWRYGDKSASKRCNNHFSGRATVGKYFIDGFDKLINNLPTQVTIHKHIGEVIDVERKGQSYSIIYKVRGELLTIPQKIHNILLTTGHAGNKPMKCNYSGSSTFIDYVYPVNEKMGHIRPNSKVGVKGMGLTFIDTVLALTEGRGGKFVNHGSKTTYSPSGKEPKSIFPYSKSGLPMIAKTGIDPSIELRYFTQKKIRNLQNPASGKYNFQQSLLPEIKKEIFYQYYYEHFQEHGQHLLYNDAFHLVEKQVNKFHRLHPHLPRFSFDKLVHPIADPHNHAAVENYLKDTICKISTGDSLSAASTVWRKISPVFNELYSFGGLDDISHKTFDKDYFGIFNRISYGPPIENMKKILTLAENGYIDFTYSKSPTLHHAREGKFHLHQLIKKHSSPVVLDYLIDARIPKTNLRAGSRLFKQLIKRNLVNPYRNGSFEPGCISISRTGHPITKSGKEITNITVYGTPTEGITLDNDTLSRGRNDMVSNWAKDTVQDILNYYEYSK